MAKQSALLKKYKEDPRKLSPKQKDELIQEYAPLIKYIAQKIAVRLPSNIELSAAELELVSEVGREHVLASALNPLLNEYDFIIIDCQPSLGLLTVNALAASEGCIVPLETEYFALRGLALLTQTIEKIKGRINPKLQILGILPTMYDPRTVHGREVLERVEEAFGDKVFETVIARTVKFPETTAAGSPITEYAPSSPAAKAYKRLARELIHKIK